MAAFQDEKLAPLTPQFARNLSRGEDQLPESLRAIQIHPAVFCFQIFGRNPQPRISILQAGHGDGAEGIVEGISQHLQHSCNCAVVDVRIVAVEIAQGFLDSVRRFLQDNPMMVSIQSAS